MGKNFAGSRNSGYNQLAAGLVIALAMSACNSTEQGHLKEVTGHLPDLSFSLSSDEGQPVTAKTYEGKVLLMYFGFTHCREECPISMARLTRVMHLLGEDADRAHILFVTVDPTRDGPGELRRYLTQFDLEQAIGLTGTPDEIGALAKRYRNAFRPHFPPGGDGGLMHGDAVYIFDTQGRARLLATSADSEETLAEDLRDLLPS
ncbi:protein SCO1/2 [Nitrosospira multiformis]|uniref:Protein SCO1/2 n=1 Tax=Nitrosospira multiformis TaxID=1231 RepID=A0A1H8D7W0_9PROT|nr:protein SCO1/2 [Nitrosospira multiformis]